LQLQAIAPVQNLELFKASNGEIVPYVRDLAVDRSGNLIAVGSVNRKVAPSNPTQVFGTKINGVFFPEFGANAVIKSDGRNILWTRLVISSLNAFPATPDGYNSNPVGINQVTTDAAGNVLVAGFVYGALDGSRNAGDRDAFVIKYNANGNRLWTRLIGSAGQDGFSGIVTDAQGNVYLTGYSNGTINGVRTRGRWDQFVTKLSSAGSHIWTAGLGTVANETSGRIAIAGDKIYVTGTTLGTFVGLNPSGEDAHIAQFSSNGSRNWVWQFGDVNDLSSKAILADSSGVWIGGSTASDLFGQTRFVPTASDGFVARYSTAGVFQWGKLTTNASNGSFTDATGYLYTFQDSDGVNDLYLNPNGRLIAVTLNNVRTGSPRGVVTAIYALGLNNTGQQVASPRIGTFLKREEDSSGSYGGSDSDGTSIAYGANTGGFTPGGAFNTPFVNSLRLP
jgi:Beta-propeller repeat